MSGRKTKKQKQTDKKIRIKYIYKVCEQKKKARKPKQPWLIGKQLHIYKATTYVTKN